MDSDCAILLLHNNDLHETMYQGLTVPQSKLEVRLLSV